MFVMDWMGFGLGASSGFVSGAATVLLLWFNHGEKSAAPRAANGQAAPDAEPQGWAGPLPRMSPPNELDHGVEAWVRRAMPERIITRNFGSGRNAISAALAYKDYADWIGSEGEFDVRPFAAFCVSCSVLGVYFVDNVRQAWIGLEPDARPVEAA
jgi:hypothetical protein